MVVEDEERDGSDIERVSDADDVRSIYEAAAHGRWAHRASLAVEQLENAPALSTDLIAEAERFGLGLYEMRRSEQGKWDVAQVREPDPREPDPQNLHDLLEYFLGLIGKAKRARFVQAIR